MSTVPFALALTPHGRVRVDPLPPDESFLDSVLATRLSEAFAGDEACGLLKLGSLDASTPLPASVTYLRELTNLFLARLCALPDLESLRERAEVSVPVEELLALAGRVPPMTGAEYATPAAFDGLWNVLLAGFRREIAAFEGSVEGYLHGNNPLWNLVGRVCFHLAENRTDPSKPFAFLATYSSGVSAIGRVQHRPLGHALEEYAGAGKKAALLALLQPIQKAADRNAFVKGLVDGGRLFQPQAWTAAEAHRFLHAISDCEASGIVVRVPDWWKPHAPPRVDVQVSIGKQPPSKVGVAALVDFQVALAVDGEPIDQAEWAALRAQTSGLMRLRGKWVEVDHDRLDQLLEHWQTAKKANRDGIPFHEAMRMLAGVRLGGDESGDLFEGNAARVIAGPWLAETLAQLRQSDADRAVHPGQALKATLRPYQEAGVRWLWYLNQLSLGGCLADDMGLGKTIQVLSLFLLIKEHGRRGPHLLVLPATLLANWQAEGARFAPSLSFFIAHPSATSPARLEAGCPADAVTADVVMTTYASLYRYDWLRETAWDTVVLDEAQAIKNAGARQTQAAKAVKSRVRLALTGTPVENRLADLWSLFDFLNRGLLGTSKELSAFLKRSQEQGGSGTAALRELVKPYLLRRLKTDRRIIADLPDKTEVRAFCTLTKVQAALYQGVVDDLAEQLKSAEGIGRKGVVLASLMKLKQICNHPSQFAGDQRWEADRSGKFDRIREIVEPIAARQEKALFFTQFREMTDPLAAFLASLPGWRGGKPGLVLHGETPLKIRRERVEKFQSDESVPFMVLTVKAGGTGLNLTAANHVIHFDRWWNPAVENQATDRAFRIGQKKNVLVQKFVCRGTVEERIDEMIESKKKLSTDLLEGGGEVLLTELDNKALLRVVALDLKRAVADA